MLHLKWTFFDILGHFGTIRKTLNKFVAFGLFGSLKKRVLDGPKDGPRDERTDPLIDMHVYSIHANQSLAIWSLLA